MKILLDGYADNNLGDDLMLLLSAKGLAGHDLYTPHENLDMDNVRYTTAKCGFDVYLKVTGSGFLIHNSKGILYRLRDMRRENTYAPIRAAMNCNISPFVNIAAEKVIQSQLGGYDFITARDEFSYEYITKRAKNKNCVKYPDMVFALPDGMIPDAPCERALGIAVRNGMDCAGIAKVADGYIKQTGNKVKILCFNTGEENDELASLRVCRNMKYADMAQTAVYKNIPDMLAEMKTCSVILGARFHSNVLAARMGIPFVPLSYSEKTENALAEIGYSDKIYSYNAFNADEVIKKVLNAKPFELNKNIIASANNHILKFDEFLKKQA